MAKYNEKIPDPKEIERELGEFLAKKFGGDVKIVSPMGMPEEVILEKGKDEPAAKRFEFDLKPEDLVSYLDQYIVRQDEAKAVLSTKICTHFNRIVHSRKMPDDIGSQVGNIKNNVIMIGPTGVGKTYMIKLIAKKIGVPFVKGDATKFSETGYVGGDVEDLVRDLVREADDNIELAEHGIIYLDEIDKIASNRHIIGSDISRTGVQRALLKPMEETEVELKVPHDPISMIQEIERFRKTGKRDKRTVNTKNILFIMSGAFADLGRIIHRRLSKKGIGFGAEVRKKTKQPDIMKHVRSEDLIEFGFESEFVGRLPVHAVFGHLAEDDLFQILKNPNNPVILGKKLDFAAYGIDVKFSDEALRILAKRAFGENTGARGLVSAIEKALMNFEKTMPSTDTKIFPVTEAVIEQPDLEIETIKSPDGHLEEEFRELAENEIVYIRKYIQSNSKLFTEKYGLTLTPSHVERVASNYCKHVMDIGSAIQSIKYYTDEIKKIELFFYKNHDINMVIEDDAVDFILGEIMDSGVNLDDVYHKLTDDLKLGLKLVREKTGRNRFFITKEALLTPDDFISKLIKNGMKQSGEPVEE